MNNPNVSGVVVLKAVVCIASAVVAFELVKSLDFPGAGWAGVVAGVVVGLGLQRALGLAAR